MNATYYSPDIDEQALDSQYGILGPGMSGITGGVADTSPTHINQLNSTAHHQNANSHIDSTGSVGMYQISLQNLSIILITFSELYVVLVRESLNAEWIPFATLINYIRLFFVPIGTICMAHIS